MGLVRRESDHRRVVETIYGNSDFLKRSMDLMVQRTEDKQKGKEKLERMESFSSTTTTTKKKAKQIQPTLDPRTAKPASVAIPMIQIEHATYEKRQPAPPPKPKPVEKVKKMSPKAEKPKSKKIQAAEQV